MTVWQDSRATPGARREIFSPYGYLFFFVGTVVTAILAR
jgi:hypothetical protein